MTSATTAPPARPPVLTTVVGTLALLPYAMMLAGIDGLHDVDGISRGLAAIYALASLVILWVLLAAMLINAAIAGAMPTAWGIVAFVLTPASLAASVMAIDLLSGDGYDWAIAVPILLPPLLALYALWARLPRWHPRLKPHPTSTVLWGMVLLLSAAPVAGLVARDAMVEAKRREVPFVTEEQRREQERQERLARFEQLTPASPLGDYLQYLGRGDELREPALAALRQLPDRQQQAETMLRQGWGIDIVRQLAVLDLEPTASLCAAAADYLQKRAEDYRPKGGDPSFWQIEDEREIVMPAFEWLEARRCAVGEALAELEAVVRAYPETSYANNSMLAARRQAWLDELARLRAAAGR